VVVELYKEEVYGQEFVGSGFWGDGGLEIGSEH
jgi:hypothetical protein